MLTAKAEEHTLNGHLQLDVKQRKVTLLCRTRRSISAARLEEQTTVEIRTLNEQNSSCGSSKNDDCSQASMMLACEQFFPSRYASPIDFVYSSLDTVPVE